MSRLALVACVAFTCLAACRKNADDRGREVAAQQRDVAAIPDEPRPPPPPPSSMTAASFCDRFFGSTRAAIQELCTAEDLNLRPMPDFAIDNGIGYCRQVLEPAIAAGRISLAAGAPACVERQEAWAREREHVRSLPSPDLLAECRGVVVGVQPVDAPCDDSLECAAGLSCLDGRCVAPAATGAACANGGLMDEFSDHPSCAEGYCDGGTCKPAVKPPVDAKVGNACDPESAMCDGGTLYCDPATRKCATPKRAGKACKEGFECRGECGWDHVCVSLCGSG
jgi:hypothetical protein